MQSRTLDGHVVITHLKDTGAGTAPGGADTNEAR